jgi:3-dehydroquinate dehydratase
MSKPAVLFRTATTALAVGAAPRVVGTLCSLERRGELFGDIVEVRLDKIRYGADWLDRCVALQSGGKPVLLTVRLGAEGGGWEADDQERLELYRKGLSELAAVDVELRSVICRKVARVCKRPASFPTMILRRRRPCANFAPSSRRRIKSVPSPKFPP